MADSVTAITSTFDALDEWLQAMPDRHSLNWEIKKLRAIRAWALENIGVDFAEGDTVEFVKAPNTDNGWRPYAECLVEGAKAQVRSIDFNAAHHYWFAEIVLEREWSYSDYKGGTRYWHGRASETPPGMKPPSAYDMERSPEGRKGVFCMPVKYLRRVQENGSSKAVSSDG